MMPQRLDFRRVMFNVFISHFAVRTKYMLTQLASVANPGDRVTRAVASNGFIGSVN